MPELRTAIGLGRFHWLRVELVGEVREVRTNLSWEDVAAMPRGLAWLERLAREYGRPVVQDGAA